jgi:hypothetical protein
MHWTKYNRNAIPGERVLFYPGGRRNATPVVADVTDVGGVCVELSLLKVRSSRMECLSGVRHINDPHWKDYPDRLQTNGAWDFHPVFGGITNAQIDRVNGANKRAEQMKQEHAQMTADEYEALRALEMHGPVMSRISETTGLSVSRLNGLQKFNDAFKAAKLTRWEEKNDVGSEATSDLIDDDTDDEDAPGDVGFCKGKKQAVELFGVSEDEWDEMKSRDGFPEYTFPKGWSVAAVREWMTANLSEA